MERRIEPRFEANEPVVVTELSSRTRQRAGGMIHDISGGGMLIKLPRAIASSTPVRVETSEMLLLGEVVRCEPEGEYFRVGLKIRHSLKDLHDLERLSKALTGSGFAEERDREPQSIAPL